MIQSLSEISPTLTVPINSSRILGLYFASSWCPDCTPITPKLKSIYDSQNFLNDISEKKLLEIVYVSSDSSSKQMKDCYESSHGKWVCIPFDRSQEIIKLKQKYGVCAAKEAAALFSQPGERKFGIPTLILVNCENGEILTTDGVDDVLTSTENALPRWEGLL